MKGWHLRGRAGLMKRGGEIEKRKAVDIYHQYHLHRLVVVIVMAMLMVVVV